MSQVFSPQQINTLIDFFQEVCLWFGKSWFKEYHRLGTSETLRASLLSSQRCLITNIFFMIKKNTFCRMNIYLKKIYISFVKQTFSG